MDNPNLFDRREEALNQLAQFKEAIERVAATGVPLLHLDTELVSHCLHFVLGEIALRNALKDGITYSPQYDTSPYMGQMSEDIPTTNEETKPESYADNCYDMHCITQGPQYDIGPHQSQMDE